MYNTQQQATATIRLIGQDMDNWKILLTECYFKYLFGYSRYIKLVNILYSYT
jgi:hypothetical protein